MSDLIDYVKFVENTSDSLGVAVRKPLPVTLGYTENGVKKLKVGTGENAAAYYFSGAPGTEFTPGVALNSGSNPLEERFLIFGAKVYVRQDELNPNIYYLAGLQPTPTNAQAIDEALPPPKANYLHEFIPGLLDQTDPPSMKVRVMGAPYTMAGTFRNIETQRSIDFTSQLPATPGKAIYARVAVVFDTGTLDYAYGSEIDALLTHSQAFQQDGGTGTILSETPQSMFRAGFVRLVSGMTSIRRVSHIFPAQEVLARTDYRDILNAADEVVTVDGNVVYV